MNLFYFYFILDYYMTNKNCNSLLNGFASWCSPFLCFRFYISLRWHKTILTRSHRLFESDFLVLGYRRYFNNELDARIVKFTNNDCSFRHVDTQYNMYIFKNNFVMTTYRIWIGEVFFIFFFTRFSLLKYIIVLNYLVSTEIKRVELVEIWHNISNRIFHEEKVSVAPLRPYN